MTPIADNINGILLLTAALSVFVGWSRGFCDETARFAAYAVAGVFGWLLIPVVKPLVKIENEAAQTLTALMISALVVSMGIRLLLSSVIKRVKNGEYKRIDQTGGALFGAVRACFFILVAAAVCAVVLPRAVENSGALQIAYQGARNATLNLTGVEVAQKVEFDETTDDRNWKKNALRFLQTTKVYTEKGEKPLFDYACAYARREYVRQSKQRISFDDFCDAFRMTLEGKSQDEIAEYQAQKTLDRMPMTAYERRMLEKLRRENAKNTGD